MWCASDFDTELQDLVRQAWRLQPKTKNQDHTRAEMRHSDVIQAMVSVSNRPEVLPFIVKLTQLLEDAITQKEDCGVITSGTHNVNASIQTKVNKQ